MGIQEIIAERPWVLPVGIGGALGLGVYLSRGRRATPAALPAGPVTIPGGGEEEARNQFQSIAGLIAAQGQAFSDALSAQREEFGSAQAAQAAALAGAREAQTAQLGQFQTFLKSIADRLSVPVSTPAPSAPAPASPAPAPSAPAPVGSLPTPVLRPIVDTIRTWLPDEWRWSWTGAALAARTAQSQYTTRTAPAGWRNLDPLVGFGFGGKPGQAFTGGDPFGVGLSLSYNPASDTRKYDFAGRAGVESGWARVWRYVNDYVYGGMAPGAALRAAVQRVDAQSGRAGGSGFRLP